MSEDHQWNKKIIEEFRANAGKVGGWFEGKTLLLLHTKGAKSGEERINPVAYVRDGECWAVIASNSGAPTHPAWYFNLLAHPDVTIEVGTETYQVHAAEADEPERTRLYDEMAEMMPVFDGYRKNATRRIPVLVLMPVKRV